ncbi:MAG: LysE/ArgO family amino acid transporter [Micropruina sp.]|uniref:LysE/ArgO family amino acid transporter n=1 Tax=Micropruina sp. TaxID=2737536 RepID=UPI0039E37BE1
MSSYLAGLGLGFSLIIAIGAQNVFVLRQGIRRDHVLLTATICAVSDAVLIVAGVSGIGLVLHAVPWLFDAVRWAGAAFLLGYGVLAGRRAWRGENAVLEADDDPAPPAGGGQLMVATSTRAVRVAMTALALTWLNPSVYVDTVFLLGTVANAQGEGRWVFAVGAMTASVIWFFGVALGARLLAGWLATARAWRIFDASIAVLMIVLAGGLVFAH